MNGAGSHPSRGAILGDSESGSRGAGLKPRECVELGLGFTPSGAGRGQREVMGPGPGGSGEGAAVLRGGRAANAGRQAHEHALLSFV